MACGNDNFELIKLLVDHGANVNAKDYENNTPLLFAVDHCSFEVVEYLISKGADLNSQSKMNSSPTPIFKAVTRENPRIVELLINHGANLKQKNYDGETPYQFALRTGRKNMSELLKKAEENLSPTIKST